ncbi:MAG: c-type cytochrome [Gemmatimonadota bacterium]|nr:c-type cytochrome [Gemmatimonadota bacterium]
MTSRLRIATRAVVPALVLGLLVPRASSGQFPPDSLKNLEVLPADITPSELIGVMRTFARGLGVRCQFCHVGEEGQPLSQFDFVSDEKAAKQKAREMIRMVREVNDRFLADLPDRGDPPVAVTCTTCHRGVSRPRMVEDILLEAYADGAFDGMMEQYRTLHDRHFGGFAYDFSDRMMVGVAGALEAAGQSPDALRALAFNLEQYPNSFFTQLSYANLALERAVVDGGAAGLRKTHTELVARFPARVFPENLLNQIGYRLLRGGDVASATETFLLNAQLFPNSANAFDSLGEAYATAGDRRRAVESYERSLTLNPDNANAKERLSRLRQP